MVVVSIFGRWKVLCVGRRINEDERRSGPDFFRGRREKYLGFYIDDVLFFTTTILKRRGWSHLETPSVLLCVSTETTTSLCTQHEYQKDKTTEELLLGGTLTDAHALTQIFVFEFSRRAAESSAAAALAAVGRTVRVEDIRTVDVKLA